jgi:hypothetical protein
MSKQHLNNGSSSDDDETWAEVLETAVSLKRADQLKLVKGLAGQLGMIAVFPNQLATPSQSAQKGPKERREKQRGNVGRKPTNPLHGTEVAKAFSDAKKAVIAAKGGKKGTEAVPQDLIDRLESAKGQYFSALTAAKGQGQSV